MVEELDQDLDLFADGADGEDNKKSGITSVGLKKNIADAGKSEESKAEDDDEVQMEDPSEDVNEEGEEGKKSGEANASTETKLPGAQEDAAPKYDYSLLDMITQFLYEDAEPLPILCGYFTKIMDQLLDKQKQMTLEYLLLHGQGKIFNGLL